MPKAQLKIPKIKMHQKEVFLSYIKVVFIKHGKTITKFKLRYSRYLYTFKTDKK